MSENVKTGLGDMIADPCGEMAEILQASMVWNGDAPAGKQAYLAFRKSFELAALPESAVLNIFADSRYVLWVNGEYVLRGPCRFDPVGPEYDVVDVLPFLREGRNVLAVLGHHYVITEDAAGEEVPQGGVVTLTEGGCHGRTMRHEPAVTAVLELPEMRIVTDASWMTTNDTPHLPSPPSWSSICDRVDARHVNWEWMQPEFDDSGWESASAVDGNAWGKLSQRVIPLLKETEIFAKAIVQETRGDVASDEMRKMDGALPLVMQAPHEVVIDIGRMTLGYSVLEFDAEEGSELEVRYAQLFFDTGRKPGDMYDKVNVFTARAGSQEWMSLDTFGCKYLVVTLKSGRITLNSIFMVERVYPFERMGAFYCSDSILNYVWRISAETVRLCSEDAYIDGALRERVEWMGDGIVIEYPMTRVAMAGPADAGFTYGDARLLRNMVRHMAQSQQEDGRVKAHHPTDRWDIHGYIEDYSCLWVQAIREYYEHTGDASLVKELWPAVVKQMDLLLSGVRENGLIHGREFVFFDNALVYKYCEGATLNASIYRALLDAAILGRANGADEKSEEYEKRAAGLIEAFNRELWDEENQTYYAGVLEGEKIEASTHSAMFALERGLVPEERVAMVAKWLMAHYRETMEFPYSFYFLFRALYSLSDSDADREVVEAMRDFWTPMTKHETGTCSEALHGGEMCHNAGAVPGYFLSAYVLGARMERPVWEKRLTINPRPGGLTKAKGRVVTELGPVDMEWQSGNGRFEFEFALPSGCGADVIFYPVSDSPRMVLNGVEFFSFAYDGKQITFNLAEGKYRGWMV